MSKGLLFWIIFLVVLLFGGYWSFGLGVTYFGGSLVIMVLIGLIGWQVFGAPIK